MARVMDTSVDNPHASSVNALGDRLRQERSRRGWSQERLAKELNAALEDDETVTQPAISLWELGETIPTRRKLRALEVLYGLPDGALLTLAGGVEEPGEAEIAREMRELRWMLEELLRRTPDTASGARPDDEDPPQPPPSSAGAQP